jgi:flagellar protein FlgJ
MDPLSFTRPPGPETTQVKGDAARLEKDKQIKKACADFEAVLVYQLMKTMRQSIPKSGLLGQSHGKETFEMMLDQKLSQDLAAKGMGLGLQKALYQQLTRQTEKKD